VSVAGAAAAVAFYTHRARRKRAEAYGHASWGHRHAKVEIGGAVFLIGEEAPAAATHPDDARTFDGCAVRLRAGRRRHLQTRL
jgi:hypothetical protein